MQLKRERERSRAEAKNLQQQLSDMHDELDNAKSTDHQERDTLLQVKYTISNYIYFWYGFWGVKIKMFLLYVLFTFIFQCW